MAGFAPLVQIQTRTHHNICSLLEYSRSIKTFNKSDFPSEWPFSDTDFARDDTTDDSVFYFAPRFVNHIDDSAVKSLTEYYNEIFAERSTQIDGALDILDVCSSWVTHYPATDIQYGQVSGVGMNERELATNPLLSEFHVHDLNDNPILSEFEDDSFDIVTNALSIDYLTRPLEVTSEIYRVLRPGGSALIAFSSRCFPSKAVQVWKRSDEMSRMSIVASYFYFSRKPWDNIEALDIKIPGSSFPKDQSSFGDLLNDIRRAVLMGKGLKEAQEVSQKGNPMFVVKATKPRNES